MNVSINYRLERNKEIICETKSFYILLALLIPVSIYCHLIKYKAKQKHLLPFYVTNNELKKFCINNIIWKWKVKMRAWVRDTDTDFNGTLLDEKLYKEKNETYLIYDIAYTLQRVDNHCVLGTIK